MSTILKTPALDVGSFYFSGTQSVLKGQEVAWVLDDIFAFKTMEDCKISANKTPFIEIKAGQVFIIRSGMKYVFDRDTIIGLAYPQAQTEELIIENVVYSNVQNDIVNNLQNEILNNNNNYVTVEANEPPTAKIFQDVSTIIIGDVVSLESQSFAVSPATIASQTWTKNGVQVGTATTYSYTSNRIGTDSITLKVVDSVGRIAYDDTLIAVRDAKLPTAKISLSKTVVTVGGVVTFDGTASIANDGTITAYEWKVDGVVKSTASTYNYTTTSTGQKAITLKVTNSYGKVAYSTAYLQVDAVPVLPVVTYQESFASGGSYLSTQIISLGSITASATTTGEMTINASCPAKQRGTDACSLRLAVYINDVLKASEDLRLTEGKQGVIVLRRTIAASSIVNGDVVSMKIYRYNEDGGWDCGIFAGGEPQLQISIDPN